MKKNFLVIGLGEFGKSVAKTLYKNKATVMAIDSNEELIKQALNEGILDEAVILDATDEIALKNVVKDDGFCQCRGQYTSKYSYHPTPEGVRD